jgi:diacylglycerol O-acyltransferase / wax synthase
VVQQDRMSALDATFLHLERGEMPMHVAALLVFEGPAPDYDEWREAVSLRLDRLPRYRQRVREIPMQLNTPVWVDDAYFNLDYHLRHVALPRPGDEAQLRVLSSRLLGQRIDMSRPLWEMWLIDGLTDGRWALLSKVHHAMVDGESGRDMLELLLETRRDAPDPEAREWSPAEPPGDAALLGSAVAETVIDPLRTVERVATSLTAPKEFAEQAVARAAGTLRVGSQMAHTEDFLMGKVGPHRRWTWVELDLATVKDIKDTFGGTVNDVLLSAIAGGFRGLLLERGEELATEATIRTMVPVSIRRPGDAGGGNLVSAIFTDLPVGLPDAVERLAYVTSAMQRVKRSPDALSVPTIVGAAPFVPPALLAAAGRVAARVPQRSVATVTTNVPGPQYPLYFMGRQLMGLIPFVPLGPSVRSAVAMMSYNGGVWCGITADYDTVPDIEQIGEGIEASVAELESATRTAS